MTSPTPHSPEHVGRFDADPDRRPTRSLFRHWFRPLGLTCAVLVIVAAGCASGSSGESGAAPGPDSESTLHADRSKAEKQPAQQLSAEQSQVIQAAIGRLEKRCMAKAGYTYRPPPPQPIQPVGARQYRSSTQLRSSGFNIDFAAELKQNQEMNAPPPPNPFGAIPKDEQKAASRAFQGKLEKKVNGPNGPLAVYTDGCEPSAYKQIYGSVANRVMLVSGQAVGVDSLGGPLAKHADYAKARSKWQACMRQGGASSNKDDTVDSGGTILIVWTFEHNAVPSQKLQAKIAKLDAKCQISSGLYEARQKELPGVEKQLEKRQVMDQHDKWQLHQLAFENAQTVP